MENTSGNFYLPGDSIVSPLYCSNPRFRIQRDYGGEPRESGNFTLVMEGQVQADRFLSKSVRSAQYSSSTSPVPFASFQLYDKNGNSISTTGNLAFLNLPIHWEENNAAIEHGKVYFRIQKRRLYFYRKFDLVANYSAIEGATVREQVQALFNSINPNYDSVRSFFVISGSPIELS